MDIKSPNRDTSEPPSLRKSLDENPYRESVASTKAAVLMAAAQKYMSVSQENYASGLAIF